MRRYRYVGMIKDRGLDRLLPNPFRFKPRTGPERHVGARGRTRIRYRFWDEPNRLQDDVYRFTPGLGCRPNLDRAGKESKQPHIPTEGKEAEVAMRMFSLPTSG